MYVTKLSAGKTVEHDVGTGRRAWIQVASGSITVNGVSLDAGDGAAVSDEPRLALAAVNDAEIIVFDLA